MPLPNMHVTRRLPASIAFLGLLSLFATAQQYTKFDRAHAQQMLRDVDQDVRKNYYDPKLRGVDWDAKVQEAKANIDKADSMDSAISEIAALMDTLNDSHTMFILPPRAYVHRYGFEMKMVGDQCLVTRVKPRSDADTKGLKPGDRVLAVNGHPVSRKTFWKLDYIYYELRPQPAFRLTLADSNGGSRQLDVVAKVEPSTVLQYALHLGVNQRMRDWNERYRQLEAQYFEKGDDLLAVRIPEFSFSAEEVDRVVGKMRKHKGVVLDLRGNPGGYEDTLDRFVGAMFENDLKIYDQIERTSNKPITANGRHHDAFTGRLVVLVDSESASASELFARIVQLEKRAFVMGDRTSGMVMAAKVFPHETLLDSHVYYGPEITVADLVMTDGKNLEHVGVDPDIEVLPTAQDLAAGRDPVMAKAVGLVGVKITPEEAGSMFPNKNQNY